MWKRGSLTRRLTVLSTPLVPFLTLACGGGEPPPPPEVARPVATFLVGQGLTSRLTFPGTVQAAGRANLAFRVSGPLIELPVNEGDEVQRGQLIARIDPRDYQIAVAEEKANFNQAVADAIRYKRLYEREAVALAELEVREARRNVSEARYDQALANLRDTRLVAPFDGQIGIKYVQNFEDVRAKEPILSLHNVDQIEIVINVPEQIIASVREGMEKTVVAAFDAAPGRQFPVTVMEFAVNADPNTQTFPVTFTMPQPEELNVLPGMTALIVVSDIAVADEESGAPLTVPAHAVFSDEAGDARVWVIDPADLTVHERPVTVGPVTGTDGIVVIDGLEAGEMIATAGIYQLQEGQTIRLMDN
jgi:RND family efflux transporter MFP subunit